jgi:polygalacturonase
MHGRPHAITITDSKESVVEGLRFVQSQMWTMTVIRSERMLLQDIYVNSTSGPGRDFRSIVNTDGVDVWPSFPNALRMILAHQSIADRLCRQHYLFALDR